MFRDCVLSHQDYGYSCISSLPLDMHEHLAYLSLTHLQRLCLLENGRDAATVSSNRVSVCFLHLHFIPLLVAECLLHSIPWRQSMAHQHNPTAAGLTPNSHMVGTRLRDPICRGYTAEEHQSRADGVL